MLEWYAVDQAQGIHRELYRQIFAGHRADLYLFGILLVQTRLACLAGAQNRLSGGDLAVGACADAHVIAEPPVIQIVLALFSRAGEC